MARPSLVDVLKALRSMRALAEREGPAFQAALESAPVKTAMRELARFHARPEIKELRQRYEQLKHDPNFAKICEWRQAYWDAVAALELESNAPAPGAAAPAVDESKPAPVATPAAEDETKQSEPQATHAPEPEPASAYPSLESDVRARYGLPEPASRRQAAIQIAIVKHWPPDGFDRITTTVLSAYVNKDCRIEASYSTVERAVGRAKH